MCSRMINNTVGLVDKLCACTILFISLLGFFFGVLDTKNCITQQQCATFVCALVD